MTAVWDDPGLAGAMREQHEGLEERLRAGHRLLGWKLGLGASATMRQVGISAPLVGYLTSATVLESGAEVAVGGWTKPVVEPEVAITMATDLGPGADEAQVRAAVGDLAPAIELADVDTPLDRLDAVIRDDIFHRHVILGEPRRAEVSELRIRVHNRGAEVGATDDPEGATGRLVALVAHVADWLHQVGRRLEAGQVVIAGSVIPMLAVRPGDVIDYSCEPLGRLSVSITA